MSQVGEEVTLWHWEGFHCDLILPGDVETYDYKDLTCGQCIAKVDGIRRRRKVMRKTAPMPNQPKQ